MEEPRTKVKTMILSTGIPMRGTAIRSQEMARMAMPILVLRMMVSRKAKTRRQVTITITLTLVTATPPMW